jgi:hypothetical protein
MAMSIQNPSKCEVRAVIRFLHTKGETAAEIHRQLVSVYGEVVMNRENVAKNVVNLKSDDEIIQKTDENIRADRRLTIDELFPDDDEVQDGVMI